MWVLLTGSGVSGGRLRCVGVGEGSVGGSGVNWVKNGGQRVLVALGVTVVGVLHAGPSGWALSLYVVLAGLAVVAAVAARGLPGRPTT